MTKSAAGRPPTTRVISRLEQQHAALIEALTQVAVHQRQTAKSMLDTAEALLRTATVVAGMAGIAPTLAERIDMDMRDRPFDRRLSKTDPAPPDEFDMTETIAKPERREQELRDRIARRIETEPAPQARAVAPETYDVDPLDALRAELAEYDEEEVPEPPPDEWETWDRRLTMFKQNRLWLPAWGPRPSQHGCQAPVELLDQHRIIQGGR